MCSVILKDWDRECLQMITLPSPAQLAGSTEPVFQTPAVLFQKTPEGGIYGRFSKMYMLHAYVMVRILYHLSYLPKICLSQEQLPPGALAPDQTLWVGRVWE